MELWFPIFSQIRRFCGQSSQDTGHARIILEGSTAIQLEKHRQVTQRWRGAVGMRGSWYSPGEYVQLCRMLHLRVSSICL